MSAQRSACRLTGEQNADDASPGLRWQEDEFPGLEPVEDPRGLGDCAMFTNYETFVILAEMLQWD